ncbi:MAG: DUF362 domain-containing protein [Promethearchaeota archaeon]
MDVVSVLKDGNIEDMVERAVNLVGGLEDIIDKGDRVLIKPNLAAPKQSNTGATTNPRVVLKLIALVKSAGGIPLVGESPIVGYDTEEVFYRTKYKLLMKGQGIDIIDFNADTPAEVSIKGALALKEKVRVAKPTLECDKFISVPVMKTHDACTVTLSLKNLKGCMYQNEKYKSHRVGVHEAIVDLNTLIKPDFAIIDGIVGMEGLGPTAGDPVRMNMILAGKNLASVDTIASTIMGFDANKIRHIQFAAQKGFGTTDLQKIEVLGEPIQKVFRKFKEATW